MQDIESKGLDKLSYLAAELEAVEEFELGELPVVVELAEARERVVTALIGHRNGLFSLADALSRYRPFFKEQQGWLRVLDRIAAASSCSAKTLSRLLQKYDTARGLGPFLFDKMLEQRIDPRLPQNRPVVEMLERAPKPANLEEASAAVTTAKVLAMKRTPANDSVQKVSGDDSFAKRLKNIVEPWYHGFPRELRDDELRYVLEKLINSLRVEECEIRLYSRPDQVRRPALKGGR